jgi:hypothetical protein
MSTLRTVIAVAVQRNWHLEHSDVSNAYINSSFLEDGDGEEIFMEQPQGLNKKGKDGEYLVCKLKKGLYGLKQSGRMWNKNIHKKLTKLGFAQSLSDTCLYTKRDKDKIIAIVLFVDDMILAGDNGLIQTFKKQISEELEMVHEGKLSWLLGIKVERTPNGDIILHQENYIQTILKRFGLDDCKAVSTPGEGVLSHETCPKTEKEKEKNAKIPSSSSHWFVCLCCCQHSTRHTRGNKSCFTFCNKSRTRTLDGSKENFEIP